MTMLVLAKAKQKATPTAEQPVVAKVREFPTPLVTDQTRVEVELKLPLAVAESLVTFMALVMPFGNAAITVNNRYHHAQRIMKALQMRGVGCASQTGAWYQGDIKCANQTKELFEQNNSGRVVIERG